MHALAQFKSMLFKGRAVDYNSKYPHELSHFLYPIYTAFHDIDFLNLDCLNRQLIIFCGFDLHFPES